MKRSAEMALANAFGRLCLSARQSMPSIWGTARLPTSTRPNASRLFSTTPARGANWLEPPVAFRDRKMMKGRPRVPTGGSTKGTALEWGDYGLRMDDIQRRISAKRLKMAEDTIKRRLRGEKFRLFKRVHCSVGVYTSGNEGRMGKGKGSFDYWATRVAINQIIFEIRGLAHEKVIRDALRLAGNKLPGHYQIVTKGEAPYVGTTRLSGVTMEELKRPRRANIPEALQAAYDKAAAPRSFLTPSPPSDTANVPDSSS